MKLKIFAIFLLLPFMSISQETYSELTALALKKMNRSKGKKGYKESFELYQKAFEIFPDSIDESGLYKASVLASELKENDLAFQYLEDLLLLPKPDSWLYIVGEYSDSQYRKLLKDSRWKTIKKKAAKKKTAFFEGLKQDELAFFEKKTLELGDRKGQECYEYLQAFNPYLNKEKRDYSLSFQITPKKKTSYFVRLPKNYDPSQKYPLLVVLHGAVKINALVDYQLPEHVLGKWNRFYTKYADKQEVILVFPKGSREYNWITPDDGFYMVNEMVSRIKGAINVDENKVFVSGHSNGATGAFSYLMKSPTSFAAAYGFNTYPKVFTGGTFLRNMMNRAFRNFSTDQDYYYPPQANDRMASLADSLNLDYKDYRYNGFPHWFPKFDESEEAFKILFEDLSTRERNPFPKEIYWEFDDMKYNEVDWIKINDVAWKAPKKDWQEETNFKIYTWLDYNDDDELIEKQVDKPAFEFPRGSAAVKAKIENNTINVESSRVRSMEIFISPEMFDLEQKIKVFINGKLYFDEKVDYDEKFMLKSYERKTDRTQIWVNSIVIKI